MIKKVYVLLVEKKKNREEEDSEYNPNWMEVF